MVPPVKGGQIGKIREILKILLLLNKLNVIIFGVKQPYGILI